MARQRKLGENGGMAELRNRIGFLLLCFFIYRLGAHIPVPGLDAARLAEMFSRHQGNILGLFNMFSGGALQRLTIFALGVMPYISASIIIQLFTAIVPAFDQLKHDGVAGRRKLSQYTRYVALGLAIVQGFGISKWLASNAGIVLTPGIGFYLLTTITLTAGTMFLMWLGEQITERGIGNGVSMLIFAGITSRFPAEIAKVFTQVRQGQMQIFSFLLLVMIVVAVTAIVVFIERGQRQITVNYARRQMVGSIYSSQTSNLPLKLNMSGVIPPIFASSMILFPATLAQWFGNSRGFAWLSKLGAALSMGQPLYMICYAAGIVFFSYFYAALVFNPKEIAENLQKSGAFIPGIRPGNGTANYIDEVITRLTFFGAIYITLISLMPDIIMYFGKMPIYFGGTSLLIVVVVLMEFMSQIQAHLFSMKYDTIMKKGYRRKRTG